MWQWADALMESLLQAVGQHRRFASWAGAVLAAWIDGPREIAVAAADTSPLSRVAHFGTAPGMVWTTSPELPLLAERHMNNDDDVAYVCQRFVCQAPTTDAQTLTHLVAANVPSE